MAKTKRSTKASKPQIDPSLDMLVLDKRLTSELKKLASKAKYQLYLGEPTKGTLAKVAGRIKTADIREGICFPTDCFCYCDCHLPPSSCSCQCSCQACYSCGLCRSHQNLSPEQTREAYSAAETFIKAIGLKQKVTYGQMADIFNSISMMKAPQKTTAMTRKKK